MLTGAREAPKRYADAPECQPLLGHRITAMYCTNTDGNRGIPLNFLMTRRICLSTGSVIESVVIRYMIQWLTEWRAACLT